MTGSTGFHLAWCKHYVHLFAANPVRNSLFYALVPTGLGGFVGAMRLQTMNECGRPCEVIYATQYDLLSLRTPDLRPETEDPTVVMPGWSKMPLPAALVRDLRVAGGWQEPAGDRGAGAAGAS